MDRREFLKHGASGTGAIAVAVAVLQWMVRDISKHADDHENRIRELEAYNNANVLQIQRLKDKLKLT